MNLFLRIFILLFSISILPLAGLGAFMWGYVENTMRESVDESLLGFSLEIGGDISRIIADSYETVTLLADNPLLQQLNIENYDVVRQNLEMTRHFHPILKDISLVDLNGAIISSAEYSFRGSMKDTAWFQSALAGKRYLSDVHVVLYPHDYVLTAGVPVFAADGSVLRVIVCDLSLDYLMEIIQKLKIGSTGRVSVFNREGLYVATSNRNTLLEKVDPTVGKYAKNLQGNGVIIRDESSVFAVLPIQETDYFPLDWLVIVEKSRDEAYSAIDQSRFVVLITITLCLFCIVFLSWGLGNWISARLDNLLKANRALASGDFSYALRDEGHDEIGELARAYEIVRKELGSTRKMIVQYSQNLESLVEERTEDLKATQAKLLDSAHRAGMAEVATGVLHNIGNINTTINVTIERVILGLKSLPASSLVEIVALMKERSNDLSTYLSEDARGQKILPYMELTLHEQNDKISNLLEDVFSLSQNMSHVNDIIGLQQSYARETLEGFSMYTIEDLVYEALRIIDASVKRRSIKIISEFTYKKEILANRPQMIQILLNLFKNAIESFDRIDRAEKVISIAERLAPVAEDEEPMVELTVSDNGEGFDSSVAVKMFNYGYSTKEKYSGTGYGLHFCSNYLLSIGGNLFAHSDGKGQGASFTVLYPVDPRVK